MFQKTIKFDFPFIDIHSHILYGVDDGSDDLETSMKMLKLAYNENIKEIVVTPHFHPVKCTAILNKEAESFLKLQEMARQLDEDFKIYLGREVYYTSDVLEELDKRDDLCMNGGMYLLVEYSTNVERSYLYNSVINISQNGKIPIIAHIERYASIMVDISFVAQLKNAGAIIQINASSVLGEGGNHVQKTVKTLLKKELVDLIATDAHNADKRSPKIMDCMTYIVKKFGYKYARKLLYENPIGIINNEEL